MPPVDASGKPCVWWDGQNPTPDQANGIIKGMDEVHAFIAARAKNYLINHGDLKTWHRKIFKDAVPVDYYAGQYRSADIVRPCLAWDVQVISGVLGSSSGFPFAQVPKAMEDLSTTFQNGCSQLSTYLTSGPSPRERNRRIVILLALSVGEFIRIHPFVNGNGRISRFLANYICHRYDLPQPFSTPNKRPELAAYEDAHALSMSGNHDSLYVFFLHALSVSNK
jgi:fido (protein-threonine AMPylation protein)